MGLPAIRVTTYPLSFDTLTYDVQLRHTLAPNYFVLVEWGNTAVTATPAASAARVTHDPYGTGDLAVLDKNALRLTRGSAAQTFVGAIHVVECLRDPGGAGFRLVDVQAPVMSAPGVSGAQSSTDTSAAWTTLGRVCLFGGHRGGGVETSTTSTDNFQSLAVRLVPSSTSTITWHRYGTGSGSLASATATVYVVEWGDEWTVQRVTVAGSNGGGGLDAAGEWNTQSITSTARASTWVWGCGTTQEDGAGESFAGLSITLGDGVTELASEVLVAAACGAVAAVSVEVWTFAHPSLAVEYQFQAYPSWGTSTTVALETGPDGGEWYPTAASPFGEAATAGFRLPVFTGGSSATLTTSFSRGLISARVTASQVATLSKGPSTSTAVGGWLLVADFAGVLAADTATDGGDDTTGPDQYLILPDRNLPGSLLSATSEADYRVGPALAGDSNRGNLVCIQTGIPTQDSEIDYRITRGGAVNDRAMYVRKLSSDSAAAWAGTDVPTFFSDHGVPYGSDDMAGDIIVACGACFSQAYNREIVCAIESGVTGQLRVYYRDVDTENGETAAWTYVQITPGTTPGVGIEMTPVAGANAGIDVVERADGTLLMMYLRNMRSTIDDVACLTSADGGATWTVLHTRAGAVAEGSSWDGSTSPRGGLRLARSGQWLRCVMLVGAQNNANLDLPLRTWVSADGGASWTALATDITVAPRRASGDAVPGDYSFALDGVGDAAGSFVVATNSSSEAYKLWRASSTGEWVVIDTIEGDAIASPPMMCGVAVATLGSRVMVYMLTAKDDGTLAYLSFVFAAVDAFEAPTDWSGNRVIADLDGLPSYGPAYLKGYAAGHHVTLFGARFDLSLTAGTPFVAGGVMMRAGGWSRHPWNYDSVRPVAGNLVMSWTDQPCRSVEYAWWSWMRSPYRNGGSLWTRVTNAATDGEDARFVTGTTSSAAGYSYHRILLGTPASTADRWDSHALTWRMKVTAVRGDIASVEDTGVRVISRAGLDVSIRIGTNSIVIYDNHGTTTLATLTSTGTSALTEFRLGIAANEICLSYRPVTGRTDGAWTSTSMLAYTVSAGADQEARIGILAATAGTTSTYAWSEFGSSYRNTVGQDFADLTIPDSLPGQLVERAPVLVRHGVWASWGGSGGAEGDTFTGTLDHGHGLEALALDSPRFDWRSTSLVENGVVLRAGSATDVARWEINTVALVGTVDRTARIQLHTADSWSAPTVDEEVSADIVTDLTVVSVAGACVEVVAAPGSRLPALGETAGLFLRLLTAGATHSGKTFRVLQDQDRGEGFFQVVDGTDLAAQGVVAGATMVLFGDRMVWRAPDGAINRYKFLRVEFPDVSASPATLGTATSDHRLGAVVPGFVVDFSVPMEWSFADSESALVNEIRTEANVSSAVRLGPPARSYEGRVFGDVGEFRRSLRGALRAHAGYNLRPSVLVLDGRRLHPETVIYGRWKSNSNMAEAAWYQDAQGEWRTAGDVDVVFVEEV